MNILECGTKLPVLEAIIEAIPEKEDLKFESVCFVCVQHLLFTTIPLMDSLVKLGALPHHIYIMGKSYSSSSQVVNILKTKEYNYYPNESQKKLGMFSDCFQNDIKHMWEDIYKNITEKSIKLIVVLDDGGFCLTNVPQKIRKRFPIIGVEQTTSGLTNVRLRRVPFPVIEVAVSAAKQLVESPMIAEAVVQKLNTLLPVGSKNLSCAVAGLGCIGIAVTKKLLSLNHTVKVYDREHKKNKAVREGYTTTALDIDSLLREAEYIFGCAGEDITKNLDVNKINGPKTFISCSSRDKEFLTLLNIFEKNTCSYTSVLDHLECQLNNNLVKILRGGFPINFDNSGESVEHTDIQLTRGLLLGGLIQAVLSFWKGLNMRKRQCMLDPALQSFAVSQWRRVGSTHLFSPGFLDLFENLVWIKRHSKGTYEHNFLFHEWFYNSFPQVSASKKHIA